MNGDNGIPTDCKLIKTVSLEKSKNWTVTLDGLDKDKYYYVLERIYLTALALHILIQITAVPRALIRSSIPRTRRR